MEREYFGTDGVRGTANRHPMTSEVALRLGQAAAQVFRTGTHHHSIVIGKDTRLSGYMIETALSSGICSQGVDVMLVGPLPTPGVAYITRGMRADAGVMISASHNPYQDNGIKFFDREGFKLPDEIEFEIESLMKGDTLDAKRPTAEGIGKAVRIDDAAGRYITFLKSTIPDNLSLEGLKVVVDCGHGAAYRVAPAVLSELGAHVIAVGISPDGRNINRSCGSVHPEHMCQVVRERGADCGFALDGDADRVIMCDAAGKVIDGDALMAICALNMKNNGKLNHNTLVATSMSNLGLDLCLRDNGINVVRAGVGDRYVIQAMRDAKYNLGGEQSGHLIFSDHNSTGDGTLGALQVLSIMQQTGKALDQLACILTPVPQVQTNVRIKEKRPMQSLTNLNKLIAEYERELGDRGRILVRYSGTEMLARVMVEGESSERIRSMADALATELEQEVGNRQAI